LLAYLNNELTLADLVAWAENCFVMGGISPDEDIPVLRDVVSYLAGADSSAFPLTWDVSMDFLRQLGTPVRIVPV
jgi:hypothetical protein